MRRMAAEPSAAATRTDARQAWIAFGFGAWLVGAFMLVLWAIAQERSPDVAASPYHLPLYAGVLVLGIYAAIGVVRAIRRGSGWRAAMPGYPATLVGAAVVIVAVILDVGWREGIGIRDGIEGSLAPSRIVVALGLFLVGAAPLLSARARAAGSVPLPAVIGSAGLVIGLLSWPGGFHPADQQLLETKPPQEGQSADIWIMDADGSHQTRLVEATEGANLGYASWIGDGSRVAFTRFLIRDNQPERGQASIWSADANGDNQRADMRGTDWNWIPRWSPDGAWLAFTREAPGGPWMQAGPAGPAPGGGPQGGDGPLAVPLPHADIYRVAASGGEPQRLTDSPGDDRAPVFSPDGTHILFDSTRDGNTEIYVMNADGSDERRITTDEGEDWGASWSPDGSHIAFNSTRNGDMDIYVMRADGGEIRQLTFGGTVNVAPTWSPDGTKIAYTARDAADVGQIMVIDTAGGRPQGLSRSPGTADEVWTGGWGPDGRIVFDRVMAPGSDDTLSVQEDLGAAAMLLTALMVTAVLLLLAGLNPPFGSLTAAALIGFALASLPFQDWRYVAVGLVVGLVADLVAWRSSPTWRGRLLGTSTAAAVVIATGMAVLLTTGLDWSPTLLMGVAAAAAAIGWAAAPLARAAGR
jgi:Tol biopolymer transport system component